MLVQTIISAISPGTEVLIYRGQAPQDMARDDAIAALAGEFSFPLKYGYAVVGKVVTLGPGVSPDWQDRLVFAFHPHESHFLATPDELQMLPLYLTAEDAVFFPNMETAVTFLLDGQPLMGEQVAVFGQGIVGLLLTALLARWPLNSLVTLDLYAKRRLLSENLGAQISLDPATPDLTERVLGYLQGAGPYPGADLTYEISGNPEALNQAIAVTGFNGRVVIGSWYGRKKRPEPGRTFPSQPGAAHRQPGEHHSPGTRRPLEQVPALPHHLADAGAGQTGPFHYPSLSHHPGRPGL